MSDFDSGTFYVKDNTFNKNTLTGSMIRVQASIESREQYIIIDGN